MIRFFFKFCICSNFQELNIICCLTENSINNWHQFILFIFIWICVYLCEFGTRFKALKKAWPSPCFNRPEIKVYEQYMMQFPMNYIYFLNKKKLWFKPKKISELIEILNILWISVAVHHNNLKPASDDLPPRPLYTGCQHMNVLYRVQEMNSTSILKIFLRERQIWDLIISMVPKLWLKKWNS